MGNGLIITGRALGLVGRSLVTDVGGAPCCCGGTGPGHCTPTASACPCANGCVATGSLRLRRVETIAGAFTQYAIPYECCCGPNIAWSIDATFKFYDRARCNGTLCLEQVLTVSGGGVGNGTARITNSFRGALDPVCTLNQNLVQDVPVTPLCGRPFDLLTLALGGSLQAPGFLQLPQIWNAGAIPDQVSGSRYDDCTTFVAEETISANLGSSNPCAGLRATMTARVSVAAIGCAPTSPQCGSCCCDGQCFDGITSSACAAMGGRFMGAGRLCVDVICDPITGLPRGACCLPDGTCRKDVTRGECQNVLLGVYQGDDSKCEDVNCPPPPVRACCLPGNLCLERTQAACLPLRGVWFPNAHCGDPGVCVEQTGSCCTQSGAGATCLVTTLADCGGGTWTAGGTCPNGDATCLGACCSPNPFCASGFLCSDNVGQAFCNGSGGIWHGGGSLCANVADPGGCCNSGQLRGPIRIATGSETMAVTGGCSQCGKDEVRL